MAAPSSRFPACLPPLARAPTRASRAPRRPGSLSAPVDDTGDEPVIEYAVTNPATGERLKTYPTMTDAELEAAIAKADKAHREWSASTTVEERAELVPARRRPARRAARGARRRSSCARWASRSSRRSARSASASTSTGYYADNAEELLADEPLTHLDGGGTAVVRRSSIGRPARDHAVELPLLPGRPFRGPEPDDRQHDPAQARPAVPRVGRGDARRSSTRRASPRARTSTSSPPTSRSPT